MRERGAHGHSAVTPHGTNDGALLGDVGAVVSFGEAVQPAGDPLGSDLEPPGHSGRVTG
jgi:hypothetical protein